MKLRTISILFALLLGFLSHYTLAQGQGQGNQGNGLGNPPPPIPPPPPGLPIDGAIPAAVIVALFLGIKRNLNR